ncbi:MAG: flagellar basal-body MS-ring/collar protein FliF [Oxalobacteraceae bacterium]|nr:flagellar basal-body MS-ring/collar protein FliF [Oxalobacteraceae bacterium]
MAVANDVLISEKVSSFAQTPGAQKFLIGLGIAAVIAIMAGVWIWSQQPDYRVLFSNFNDRDGGSIVASLQQMNVPYKFAEGGGAILVPAGQVHDARLKLAAQGLPKGGNVGFELMENQKLGVSQFLEQVNFQRALEGELARSIESIAAVQAARIHLALPKASVFVRDRQQPTASVLLNLHPGRTLDTQQVSAVVHLVASSVPDLPTKNVTIVDQNGNLLSETGKSGAVNGLDATQLKYVQELQQNIVRRVESIITPIVGVNNVRAEATADVDFSRSEQAAETYKPNLATDASSVRSQQSSESSNPNNANATGVPGALSNQPPVPATAPITAAGSNNAATGTSALPNTAASTRKDTTVNYEIDKTVRYVQQPMGGIKRLSVAVVVNYKRITDKSGKTVSIPLTDAEKTQISDLVKEAMGYSKERGDSLNVVNSPFAGMEREVIAELPLWKQADMIQLAKEIGKYLVAGIILLYLFFRVLKPMLRKLTGQGAVAINDPNALPAPDPDEDPVQIGNAAKMLEQETRQLSSYEKNLEMAKQLAKEDPKIVANVVKSWVNGNE